MMTKSKILLTTFFQTVFGIIKVLLLSKFNPKIKYSVKEKKCVILGNGPSFNIQYSNHMDFLIDKDIFCVNFFPATEYFEKIKPQYFITSAPELWLPEVDKVYLDNRGKLFNDLTDKVSWKMNLYIPFEAMKYKFWQDKINSNHYIQTIFYNNIGIEGWKKIVFMIWKLNLAMPRPHNVLAPAIFVAINSGYKEIYLWGADHNQFLELSVDENNTPLMSHRHFYDYDSAKPEHMRKIGRGKRKIHEILYKFIVAFASYHVLNDYAISRGAKILNMTKGSMIDAFERVDLDKV